MQFVLMVKIDDAQSLGVLVGITQRVRNVGDQTEAKYGRCCLHSSRHLFGYLRAPRGPNEPRRNGHGHVERDNAPNFAVEVVAHCTRFHVEVSECHTFSR